MSAGSTLVNRGTITAESVPNSITPGTFRDSRAFRISGAGSKVINYGKIYLPEQFSTGFEVLSGADNVVIEFLSGSLIADGTGGNYKLVDSEGANTKLIFGGTALIAPQFSQFFRAPGSTDNVVILLPGARIHTGNSLRPLAGLRSVMGSGDDGLKIGNFYDGDEQVEDRTGWVHAGQWKFGGGTDELIIDTTPGVRFSNRGGINHNRGTTYTDNAIHGLETMRIRSGNVILGGSVWMPNGKVYIHDAGRLTFEIGKRRDADGSPDRVGEMIISRLVADQVIFAGGDPRVSIQFAHYLTDSEMEKFRGQLRYDRTRGELGQSPPSGNLYDIDATLVGLGEPALSEIFVVNDVFILQNSKLIQFSSSTLNVWSSGLGRFQGYGANDVKVGVIALKTNENGGLIKGRFRIINKRAADSIGQLRFSFVSTTSTGTGNTVTRGTGGTGGGGTPVTGGGTGGTGTGGTGDTVTGDTVTGDTVTGDTVTGSTVTGDTVTGDTVTGDTVTGDTVTGSTVTGSTGGTVTGGTGDTVTGSASTGGGGGILVIGLLAALMGGLDLDESESELGQYYAFDRKPAKNRSRSSSYFSGLFRPERGMWVRPAESRFTSFGASYFGAVSHRMSWDLQQSGDYFLRASLSPATSVSPAGWHSSASGETVSLTGGWHRDDRRLQLGITHGRYDANAKFFDSATQGNLFGESTFRHTSVHASAVQELSDGPMKVSASASLMAGQVEQAAYDAENAVMRAKIPAYRQSYTGTRLGFSAKSRKWLALSDGISVKPHLKVTSMRTRSSVNDPVWLRQSDKVGAFTFENSTVLQGMPKSLNVVGIGTDVKPSDSRGVWRLGYAGMEVDGEYQHAAVAAYRMRF